MNKYNLTEPTSMTAVVVGTINGEKRTVARPDESDLGWALRHRDNSGNLRYWHRWDYLLDLFDSEPRIVDVGGETKPCADQLAPTLTEEQREAIRQLVAHWEGDPGEPDSMESVHFRSLFPEVFAKPVAADALREVE